MSVLFARLYALTSPATLAHRTVGFLGGTNGRFFCAMESQDPALVAAVGRSVAASLEGSLRAQAESLEGTDYDRLIALGAENRFRFQLGKPERGASQDVEKAVRALVAVELQKETSRSLVRRFGVSSIPPRLLSSWGLLELLDATPYVATKTKLQKMLFALQESLELDGLTGPRLRFKRYVYGPYAGGVDSIVGELAKLTVMSVAVDGSTARFEITDQGRYLLERLRALVPNYEHLRSASARVAARLGNVPWSKVMESAYADPLVRGRAMNDHLLPLDGRLAITPGLIPNPKDAATRAAFAEGNAKALIN